MASWQPATSANVVFGMSLLISFALDLANCMTRPPPPWTEFIRKKKTRMMSEESAIVAIAPRGPEADAVAALVKLGYSQGQAAESVARAANDLGGAAQVDVLIRESLRAMGR